MAQPIFEKPRIRKMPGEMISVTFPKSPARYFTGKYIKIGVKRSPPNILILLSSLGKSLDQKQLIFYVKDIIKF